MPELTTLSGPPAGMPRRGDFGLGVRPGTTATAYKTAAPLSIDVAVHHGAKLDGIQGTTGKTTNGSTTFTDAGAAFTAADVGKTIAICGAAGGGAHLVTTIAAFVSPTQVTLAAAAGQTTATSAELSSITSAARSGPVSGSQAALGACTGWYLYGTDDTAAWQAALDAVGAAKGGRITAPSGISMIAGPLQTANSYNTQLRIPYNGNDGSYTIEIEGPLSGPAQTFWNGFNPQGGLWLFSPINGTGTRPSMLGGSLAPPNTFTVSGNRINLTRVNARVMPNASITSFDLAKMSTGSVRDCYLDCLESVDLMFVAPSNVDAAGIYAPGRYGQCVWDVENCLILGRGAGVVAGEAGYINNVFSYACSRAFTLPPVDYPTKFGYVLGSWCQRGFVFLGDHQCDIEAYQTEHWETFNHGAAWMALAADYDDTLSSVGWGGRCRGHYETLAGVGRRGEMKAAGCTGATITPNPSNYAVQTAIADATIGSSFVTPTNFVVGCDGGGDYNLTVEVVGRITGATGTVNVWAEAYDVATGVTVPNGTKLVFRRDFGGTASTGDIVHAWPLRVRCPKRNYQYAVRFRAVTDAGAAAAATVTLHGTSNAAGGSRLHKCGA